MNAALCTAIAIITTTSPVFADYNGLRKNIEKQITRSNDEIMKACGCSVAFTYSSKLDFTTSTGGDLALNVRVAIGDVGTRLQHWCKKGDDFSTKACSMVKAVEIDEDSTTTRPYTVAVARGVARSYIATGKPKQMSNHGGAWVEKFLQSGKMPERKADDER